MKTILSPIPSFADIPAVRSAEAIPTVVFQLGLQFYGIPVALVHEIVQLPALTTLAGAPPELCGLLNIRGEFLPILNGRVLVGEPPRYELSNQIVIIGETKRELGLLVDQVRDINLFTPDDMLSLADQAAAPFIRTILKTSGEPVMLLETSELIAISKVIEKRI